MIDPGKSATCACQRGEDVFSVLADNSVLESSAFGWKGQSGDLGRGVPLIYMATD
jgi:hypothetical protein